MTGLLDAQGRQVDTLLTPQQNLALHQQTRQMIQIGLGQLGEHFQEMFYKQALFIEYLTFKIQEGGIDIDAEAFADWAEKRHAEIQAEMQAQQEAEQQQAVQELLASGSPISLDE